MDPGLILTLASMAANYINNRQAVQRASSLQNAMQAYQTSKARENEAAINKLVDQQTPQARANELQNIEASRQQSMQGTVDQARAASPVTQAAGTNTSSDYQQASEAAANRVAERTRRAIAQQAAVGAPGEEALSSGIRFGRAAGTVDANNQAIANVGEAYGTDIANVRPNPFLEVLSKAGMAVGGYMLGSPAAAAGTNYAGGTGGQDVSGYGGAGDVSSTGYAARRARMNSAFAGWGRKASASWGR